MTCPVCGICRPGAAQAVLPPSLRSSDCFLPARLSAAPVLRVSAQQHRSSERCHRWYARKNQAEQPCTSASSPGLPAEHGRQQSSSSSNNDRSQPLRSDAVPAVALLLMCGTVGAPGPATAAGVHVSHTDLASRTLSELSPRTAALLATVSQPIISLAIFLMLVRIVMSWYPNVKGDKLPWSAAVLPTEFFLGPTRRAVPPVGGVDVAPIIWLATFTFLNEIFLGPQGILNLLQRKLEF